MSKFDYDKYADRIKKLFNNERGSLLAQQVTKLKTPTSALSANILMGTSQLGDNGQVGFTSLSPTQNISFLATLSYTIIIIASHFHSMSMLVTTKWVMMVFI